MITSARIREDLQAIDAVEWIIVGALLLLFAGYVLQIVSLTRRVLRRVEHSEEINNQG